MEAASVTSSLTGTNTNTNSVTGRKSLPRYTSPSLTVKHQHQNHLQNQPQHQGASRTFIRSKSAERGGNINAARSQQPMLILRDHSSSNDYGAGDVHPVAGYMPELGRSDTVPKVFIQRQHQHQHHHQPGAGTDIENSDMDTGDEMSRVSAASTRSGYHSYNSISSSFQGNRQQQQRRFRFIGDDGGVGAGDRGRTSFRMNRAHQGLTTHQVSSVPDMASNSRRRVSLYDTTDNSTTRDIGKFTAVEGHMDERASLPYHDRLEQNKSYTSLPIPLTNTTIPAPKQDDTASDDEILWYYEALTNEIKLESSNYHRIEKIRSQHKRIDDSNEYHYNSPNRNHSFEECQQQVLSSIARHKECLSTSLSQLSAKFHILFEKKLYTLQLEKEMKQIDEKMKLMDEYYSVIGMYLRKMKQENEKYAMTLSLSPWKQSPSSASNLSSIQQQQQQHQHQPSPGFFYGEAMMGFMGSPTRTVEQGGYDIYDSSQYLLEERNKQLSTLQERLSSSISDRRPVDTDAAGKLPVVASKQLPHSNNRPEVQLSSYTDDSDRQHSSFVDAITEGSNPFPAESSTVLHYQFNVENVEVAGDDEYGGKMEARNGDDTGSNIEGTAASASPASFTDADEDITEGEVFDSNTALQSQPLQQLTVVDDFDVGIPNEDRKNSYADVSVDYRPVDRYFSECKYEPFSADTVVADDDIHTSLDGDAPEDVGDVSDRHSIQFMEEKVDMIVEGSERVDNSGGMHDEYRADKDDDDNNVKDEDSADDHIADDDDVENEIYEYDPFSNIYDGGSDAVASYSSTYQYLPTSDLDQDVETVENADDTVLMDTLRGDTLVNMQDDVVEEGSSSYHYDIDSEGNKAVLDGVDDVTDVVDVEDDLLLMNNSNDFGTPSPLPARSAKSMLIHNALTSPIDELESSIGAFAEYMGPSEIVNSRPAWTSSGAPGGSKNNVSRRTPSYAEAELRDDLGSTLELKTMEAGSTYHSDIEGYTYGSKSDGNRLDGSFTTDSSNKEFYNNLSSLLRHSEQLQQQIDSKLQNKELLMGPGAGHNLAVGGRSSRSSSFASDKAATAFIAAQVGTSGNAFNIPASISGADMPKALTMPAFEPMAIMTTEGPLSNQRYDPEMWGLSSTSIDSSARSIYSARETAPAGVAYQPSKVRAIKRAPPPRPLSRNRVAEGASPVSLSTSLPGNTYSGHLSRDYEVSSVSAPTEVSTQARHQFDHGHSYTEPLTISAPHNKYAFPEQYGQRNYDCQGPPSTSGSYEHYSLSKDYGARSLTSYNSELPTSVSSGVSSQSNRYGGYAYDSAGLNSSGSGVYGSGYDRVGAGRDTYPAAMSSTQPTSSTSWSHKGPQYANVGNYDVYNSRLGGNENSYQPLRSTSSGASTFREAPYAYTQSYGAIMADSFKARVSNDRAYDYQQPKPDVPRYTTTTAAASTTTAPFHTSSNYEYYTSDSPKYKISSSGISYTSRFISDGLDNVTSDDGQFTISVNNFDVPFEIKDLDSFL
jgi:hypothetical protein